MMHQRPPSELLRARLYVFLGECGTTKALNARRTTAGNEIGDRRLYATAVFAARNRIQTGEVPYAGKSLEHS
jgi:hypothetical protein